jgi:protein required for attachment to host cells
MSRLLVHHKTCVLVCDGSRALFYLNIGDAQAIQLKTIKTLHEPHAATRDLGTDRPGRSFDAMDGSRSAMEQSDLHAAAEAKFLEGVVGELAALVHDSEASAVIVVAPPRAMGVLRPRLTANVRRLLQAELVKDLVKVPTPGVEEYLQAQGELR